MGRALRMFARGAALFFLSISPAYAEGDYLSELKARAAAERLAEMREWNLLLHYVPRWFGGVVSEVDGPGFFLSPKGKTNPREELESTLDSFFTPPATDSEKQHPQCLFIARYRWLHEKLRFDPSKLPEQSCPLFDEWRRDMDTRSLSMVFASFYVNNPASLFGHTLLRIERKNRPDQSLLDYAVNYAANTGDDGGALFAVKGLTGAYPGTFSVYPYYYKVQQYANFESRDLWEYQFAIEGPQVERVLTHLWELGHTYFDYYFFDENCSYHLLSLMEMARPDLSLRNRFRFFVVPSDTVKLLREFDGLVTEQTYRPSLLSRFRQRRTLLQPAEKRLLIRMVRKSLPMEDPEFSHLSDDRKTLLADTALDYLAFRYPGPRRPDYYRDLLVERSRFGAPAPAPDIAFSSPPEESHESSRAGVSFGINQDDSFEEFRLRPTYHDLLADDRGLPRNAEIEGMRLRLRWYNREKKLWPEEAVLVNVLSLHPVEPLLWRPSWNASFGFETLRSDSCNRCSSAFVRGGAGLAKAGETPLRWTSYVLANAEFQASPWSETDYRIGPRAVGGLLVDVGSRSRAHLSGQWSYSPLGSPETDYRGNYEHRFSLTRNLEVRVELTKFKKGQEGLVSGQVYF